MRMKMYEYAKELLVDHYDKDIRMSLGIRFLSTLQVACRNGT
jgi:hypothetical protein